MQFRTVEISDPQFETTGFRYLTLKSAALKGRADVTVFIPEEAKGRLNVPVVVLLHGVYGSHWAWTMKGGAHLTLQKMIKQAEVTPFVLVMPSDGLWGDGSGYVPHSYQNFEAWIGQELPELIRQQIEEVGEQSVFFIAGLSMGGYGAFRVGIRYPQTYIGISGHSSVTDIRHLTRFVEEDWSFWDAGNEVNSIEQIILENVERVPPFRFDCGLQDELLQDNRDLHAALLEKGIEHEYREFPGGHEWQYWREQVRRSFLFFNSIHCA